MHIMEWFVNVYIPANQWSKNTILLKQDLSNSPTQLVLERSWELLGSCFDKIGKNMVNFYILYVNQMK